MRKNGHHTHHMLLSWFISTHGRRKERVCGLGGRVFLLGVVCFLGEEVCAVLETRSCFFFGGGRAFFFARAS